MCGWVLAGDLPFWEGEAEAVLSEHFCAVLSLFTSSPAVWLGVRDLQATLHDVSEKKLGAAFSAVHHHW